MIGQEETHPEFDSLEVTILVHEFSCSEESRQRSKQQVLNEAFRLVATSAGSFVTWPSEPLDLGSTVDEKKKVNSFRYDKSPPIVPAVGTPPIIKEWGSSISDDEIFTINDLQEFNTTESIGCDSEGRSKGKRPEIDTISIDEIIPQPHLYASPFLPTEPPQKGLPFSRNTPVFVDPYYHFSLHDHARVSWLIPIRGIFPWSGCSTASIFNLPMPSTVEDELISWNQASLQQFWQFLLDLQKSASLGALGISLHTAKVPKSKSNSNDRKGPVITKTSSAPSNLLSQPMEYRRRFSAVDHFKIYHDASRTFYVRKAIDCWSYHSEQDSMKVRMLKGARFPLLDDVSAAILVC